MAQDNSDLLIHLARQELEQRNKLCRSTALNLMLEIERVEAERDELKGAYILLDGLKRRVREAFESWPELAGFRDIAPLLNMKPSYEVVRKHNIEQQIKGLYNVLNRTCPVSGPVLRQQESRDILWEEIEQLRKELEK
ncbi:hypothetical protein IT774_07535 [Salinimonas marina]|uniref:Uncharacterized protein n=1 Tax=Salinimonas marina TaxID=2785918 RepID=A0A7S9HER5_9ALTE|nr:hypothetical protein [Salinimonas marina]QPG06946.1 hypothetical protein IT774_07535 [Salinimonas marina]